MPKSLKTKILLVLFGVFTLLIILTISINTYNERELVLELAKDKTELLARTYFDNVNTMMLTGTMSQRSILREKLLKTEGVYGAKIIRAEAVKKLFGKGNKEQIKSDDLDEQGLQSTEQLTVTSTHEGERSVSVIIPMLATDNYKGTNCMQCHVVPAGTLLGTVRVDYSLAELDQRIMNNLFHLSIANIIVIVLGLLAITWYLGLAILNPLIKIRDSVIHSAEKQDMTQRIDFQSNDEAGQLANAYNRMMQHFSNSLAKVKTMVFEVKHTTSEISDCSKTTTEAAEQQNSETQNMAEAILNLERSAEKVAQSADQVSSASRDADEESKDGTKVTHQAIEGITHLVASIESAATVITELDQQSSNIGAVLDVIKGIAEQTNLLALNAAIEAARAGEQGRGFSVVADEVRTLANRSQESTLEIERIIEQLQAGAKQAVEVMHEAKQDAQQRSDEVQAADRALKKIAEHVESIHQMNDTMNQSMLQQAEISRQVQSSIHKVQSLSEGTLDDARLTHKNLLHLETLASELEALIDAFHFNSEQ